MDIREVIRPFEENKEVWVQLHWSASYWEELETAFPEIAEKYGGFHSDTIDSLLRMLEYIQDAYPEQSKRKRFPLTLNFSLKTEACEKIDSEICREGGETYPYLYEFSGQCATIEQVMAFLSMYQLYNERVPWFYGYWNLSESLWIRARLRGDDEGYRGEGDETIVYGSELFVASPPEVREGRILCISFDDRINWLGLKECRFFVLSQYRKLKNYFVRRFNIRKGKLCQVLDDALFSHDEEPESVRIYNVGQGNYVEVRLTGEKSVIFDPGFEISSSFVARKDVINEIGNIKPNVVILSHWDRDHINGAAFSDKDIYHATWIVPDIWRLCVSYFRKRRIGGISDFGFQILSYLISHHPDRLFMVDENAAQMKIGESRNGYMRLWSGCRKTTSSHRRRNLPRHYAPYTLSRQNNFGLILAVKNRKSMLLPGDCDYKLMIPEIQEESFDFVMASHHGSKMDAFPFHRETETGTAIISYGLGNSYGHPFEEKVEEMREAGYCDIRRTVNFNSPYEEYVLL